MAEGKIDKALQQLFKRSVATKVLWQNADPSSTFAEQTVNVEEGYDKLLIECGYSRVDVDFKEYFIATLGEKTILRMMAGAAYTNIGYHTRNVELTDVGATIRDCYKKNLGASTAGTIDNGYLIPQKIYGIILSGGGTV